MIEQDYCCDILREANNTGTDNEGFDAAIRHDYQHTGYVIGLIESTIKYCPWCGSKL